jgi:hypothetical protein
MSPSRRGSTAAKKTYGSARTFRTDEKEGETPASGAENDLNLLGSRGKSYGELRKTMGIDSDEELEDIDAARTKPVDLVRWFSFLLLADFIV